MADISLTTGNDNYTQPEADKNVWNTIRGLQGNDTIRMYQGTALGGPGNDRIEKLADPGNPFRELQVAYWDAGNGLRVNLADGWADDGQGGRDTLIGVRSVHGSGSNDAVVTGDANDNYYWPNWGTDTFVGGAGYDGISLNSGHIEVSPGRFRNLLLDEINFVVSVDGRNATVTPKVGPSWSITVSDVEYFDVRVSPTDDSAPWARMQFADFVTPQAMAQQAIAAGGSLRWNAAGALGSAVTVTYSFVGTAPASGPGATGFRSFTEAERAVVRDMLAKTAAITNLTFTEVTESGSTVGQMRFGASQQTATKGVALMPNQPGAGDTAGDVWMDLDSMANLASLGVGSEGYQALLHEIGHALGLRHPRNVAASDNWSVQLREQDDKQSLTVMSGTPSSDGLFRSDWGPLDVLALRYLYGTRNTATGNDRYVLNASAGNREASIVDDGGIDTIDASGLATGVQLTLVPGSLSNVGISAAGVVGIDNLALPAGTVIEHAIGTAADDELIGNDADNELTGGLGNDWLDGGKGNDTAIFAGRRADYEIDHAFGFTYVRARDGTSGYDTLLNIERLRFADQTVTIGASAPLAEDVTVGVDEDNTYSGTLPLPNDVTTRTGLTWSLADNPAKGTATVLANGNFTYAPQANFWGSDSFAFRVANGTGSNVYRVYVSVKPVNDGAPQGSGQTLILAPDQPFSGRVPAATDVDNDPLSYALVTDPRFGALTFGSDGHYTYTPQPGRYGDDSFEFSVSDGMGGSSAYTVTLRVGLQTLEDTALSTSLPDPVGVARSAVSYRLATPPELGTMTISTQGQLNFTPQRDASGNTSFVYEIVAGTVVTRVPVALKLTAVNDGPPVGSDSSYTIAEDGRLEVNLPRAVDPDGDTPVYTLTNGPTLGSATISAGGRLVFTPLPNVSGADTLRYSVADSQGASRSYSVALTVNASNDAPVAADASIVVDAGKSHFGALPLATDAEGDWVMYLRGAAPTQGKVVISSLGFFTYTPNPGATGSDRFGFSVSDGNGGSNGYFVDVAIRSGASAAADGPGAAFGPLGVPELDLGGLASGPEFGPLTLMML